MHSKAHFFKIVGVFLFFVIFAILSIQIFAPTTYENLKNRFLSQFQPKISQEEELVIAFPDVIASFDPASYKASDRSRLVNMYETLVRMDSSLTLEPSLALSWGFSTDTVLEFHLRPGVSFHDGTLLTAEDVRSSIEYAKNAPNSEVSYLVSTISSIETPDSSTVRIITDFPDPLLLQKLTAIFIFPKKNIATISKTPVGTGAYIWKRYDKEKGDLELQRFSDYWGSSPKFRYVVLRGIPDREERFSAISTGGADILTAVPGYLASSLSAYDLDLKVIPSLEVNFLAFSFRPESIFSKKEAREAVLHAIDRTELLKFAGDSIEPANQFVSRGVFGYRADISNREYDLEKAKTLMRSIESFVRIQISVDLPMGFEALGRYIEDQLYLIGFDPDVQYLSVSDLTEKVMSGKSDFYLFGFRSELGDANDFFSAVAHSRGSDISRFGVFNGSFYQNSHVDELITESSRTLDTFKRSEKLQEIMKILVEDDMLGIPLFESKVMYAVRRGVHFEPRVDGYVLARDIF
ncbi:hypothetical protein HZA41_01475 [Candidatus Peregrinibacteria bacterium]|nr:hypothetical protein [Candidatus Peregrinibacteria bacterium]